MIYALSANVPLNGSSSFVVGSCIGRSITRGNSYVFHFNENLRRPGLGPIRGIVAKVWEE